MEQFNRMIRDVLRRIGRLPKAPVPGPRPPAQPPPKAPVQPPLKAPVRILRNGQPVVVRPSGRLVWQLAIDAAAGSFGRPDPDRLLITYRALKNFWAEQARYAIANLDPAQQPDSAALAAVIEELQHRVKVKFNNHTGLVRLIRGRLSPGNKANSRAAMIEIGLNFLRQHQSLLFGKQDNRISPDERYPTLGNVARFWQADISGPVVYGATILCGFDDAGELTIVNNSWYPLPENVDFGNGFEILVDKAMEYAVSHVRNQADILKPPLSPDGIKPEPNQYYPNGQVIFPFVDEKGKGQYRPAWVIIVYESGGLRRGWEVIVDAREAGQNQPILAWAETGHHDAIPVEFYANNDDVAADVATATNTNTNTATNTSSGTVDPGPNITDLSLAVDFPIDDQVGDDLRASNVYYHLSLAKEMFEEILTLAWAAPISALQMPGSSAPIPVYLLKEQVSAQFNHLPNPEFTFGEGVSTSPEIFDPTLDNEVIYHEFAHSLLFAVQPDIFNGNIQKNSFNDALNEGVAFLYGCTLSEPWINNVQDGCEDAAQWADFAYQAAGWIDFRRLHRLDPAVQRTNYDYLAVYGVFPQYSAVDPDPAGNTYACGIVWSRTVWDIRCLLGRDAANAILLRAMNISGGTNTELETPAEIMIHVDNEYSAGLTDPSRENALRLIFQIRGIMADGPVHDFMAVDLTGQACLFVATEDTTHATSGCLYSLDNGNSWTPLGLNGPAEVVALAAAERENQVVIWAASEYWTITPPLTSTVIIYRYELAKNQPNFTAPWTELPPMPVADLTLLSLAAMPDPSNSTGYLLFAGTDIGLYRFDGNWSGPGLNQRIVFDLVTTANPATVLAATDNRLRIIDDLTNLTGSNKVTGRDNLTIALRDEHVWVGTAYEGIFDYENSVGTVSQDTGLGRPVHSLWFETSTATLYAGTNDGVYRRSGSGAWTPFNNSSASGETIEKSSVSALYQVNNFLFAGTAQRGLWRIQLDAASPVWERLTVGLPRLGRLVDASVPAGVATWSDDQFAEGDLSTTNGLTTHILYIPDSNPATLSFTIIAGVGAVELTLNYIAPHVDLSQQQASGLQGKSLLANGAMDGPIAPGYYILTVKATAAPTTYQIRAALS